MTNSNGAGWTIMLADLALILFIVTASHADDGTVEAIAMARNPVPQAFYRYAPDAPALAEWVDEQKLGPGARMQISVAYAPGDEARAIKRTGTLLAEAKAAGLQPEIVLRPGEPDARLVLSYGR